MTDYRIDLKIRNNLILKRIEQCGYNSINDFCKKNKISYRALSDLVNLKETIFDKYGDIREFVINLCELLNCKLENLFTSEQMTCALKDNKKQIEIKSEEAFFYLNNKTESNFLPSVVRSSYVFII